MDLDNTTVEELVNAWPEAASLLSRLQIDFFCRTDRSVIQACAETAIDPAELRDLLSSELGIEALR
jgi:iron-sulfur cluster repair protein YtfE (RIC family)